MERPDLEAIARYCKDRMPVSPDLALDIVAWARHLESSVASPAQGVEAAEDILWDLQAELNGLEDGDEEASADAVKAAAKKVLALRAPAPVAPGALATIGASEAALQEIAHLVGTIYFYGGFKAETANERDLEARLIAAGYRYRSENEVLTRVAAPAPSASPVGGAEQ